MGIDTQKIARKCLEDLSGKIADASVNSDVPNIHDLRVAVRRTTQALHLADDKLPDGVARKVRRRIREVRFCAAAVRDRDMIHELLLSHGLPMGDPACAFLRGERAMAAIHLQNYLSKLIKKGKPMSWIELMEAK